MLIGHMINVLLLGVVIAQTYIYMITYQKYAFLRVISSDLSVLIPPHFRRDKVWLKALVCIRLNGRIVNFTSTPGVLPPGPQRREYSIGRVDLFPFHNVC